MHTRIFIYYFVITIFVKKISNAEISRKNIQFKSDSQHTTKLTTKFSQD